MDSCIFVVVGSFVPDDNFLKEMIEKAVDTRVDWKMVSFWLVVACCFCDVAGEEPENTRMSEAIYGKPGEVPMFPQSVENNGMKMNRGGYPIVVK